MHNGPTAAEIDELRAAIGWGPGSWLLMPMVEAGGILAARRSAEGELVAMGGAAHYGTACFINNMVVHPERKRQGLGRSVFEELLSRLEGLSITNVALEATDEGRPLYAQYGFETRWESVSGTLARQPQAFEDPAVTPINTSDWDAIGALDRTATGFDRRSLLERIPRLPRCREAVRLEEDGEMRAFAMAFDNRIGPVIARDPDSAERVVRALLVNAAVGTVAAIGHPQHAPFWEHLGFTVTPYDARMSRGGPLQDRPDLVFSMLTPGFG